MGLTVRLIRPGREGTSDENRHYRSGRTAWQRSGGVLGPKHDIAALTRSQLDVTSMQAVSETIAGARPDIVIHAAAYTQVDQAERDPETTYMINSLAPVVSHLPQRRRMRGWSLSARTMFSTGKKKASMPNRTVRIRSAYTAAPSCTERNSSR
ncbi:sugar nucleotide-binding protein [Paenibacillus larvae]